MLSIISVVFNEPMFIELQYKTLKKFIPMDFKYYIFDNSLDTNISNQFKEICKKLNIEYVRVETISSRDTCVRVGKSLNFALKFMKSLNPEYLMILDSDMFFVDYFDVKKEMVNYDLLGISQGDSKQYYSNQLMLIHCRNIDYQNIDFLPGLLDGIRGDCGIYIHQFLENRPTIKHSNIKQICSNIITRDNINDYSFSKSLKIFCEKELDIFDGKVFSEIYFDKKILHLRAGSNWIKLNTDNNDKRKQNLKEFINDLTSLRVISFSLYNARPKDVLNAVINCMLAPKVYPGWECWFHVDETLPTDIIKALETFEHVKVIKYEKHKTPTEAMTRRFLPLSDDSVDVMISRDADSWLSTREKVCVDEWLESDKNFHIIRDHCYHSQKIMGGMWGGKKGCIPNMREIVEKYNSMGDQPMLSEHVYPHVNKMIHFGNNQKNNRGQSANGYFNDGGKPIPPYTLVDEPVEGFSFTEINGMNGFRCAHCKQTHQTFIGGIMEKIPRRSLLKLKEYFTKYNINTSLIDSQLK